MQTTGPSAMVKQEPREVNRRAEEEEMAGGGMVAESETMDEPQISLMFGVSRFHCPACFRPVKPPTFKCEAGHVVCATCRAGHAKACARAATYAACPELDAFVRNAKVSCPFTEFGCSSLPVYYQAVDHERACPWAPCYCPAPGCDLFTSPARLLDHFCAAHDWDVTEVAYGKPCDLVVPLHGGMHALVGKEDRRVFLVSASPLGANAAVAVSLVCLRACGDAALAVQQFRCKLWVESRRSAGDLALVTFMVASKDMSGGFVAAEHGSFLVVTPDLLHDASGEAPVLRVRIDKASGGGGSAAATRSPTPQASRGGGAAAARFPTPPAGSAGRQQ